EIGDNFRMGAIASSWVSAYGKAVINDQSMYIFGGDSSTIFSPLKPNLRTKLGDLWEYNVADGNWIDLSALAQEDSQATGDFKKPCARSQHAAVLDTTKYQMLIFGGVCHIGGDFVAVSDLWQYDIVQKQWREKRYLFDWSAGPASRRHLTAVLAAAENMMYVFGGRAHSSGDGAVFDDLWKCDVSTFGFTLLTPGTRPPSYPPALYAHSAVFDDVGKEMYVFGGFDSTHQHLTDVWQYSVSSNSWSKLSPQLPLCHPFVSNGQSTLYSETFRSVIAPSGINNAESAIYLTFDTCSNEGGKVWKYYLSDGRWEQVTWSMTDHLMGHSAVYFEMTDTIYVFGLLLISLYPQVKVYFTYSHFHDVCVNNIIVFFVEYHHLNYGVKHHIFDKYFAHSHFHVFCVNNVIVFFVEYHHLNYGVKHHIFDKYFAHSHIHDVCVNNIIVFFVEYHHLNYGVKHHIFDKYFAHSQFHDVCVNNIIVFFVEYHHLNYGYFAHSQFHDVCVNNVIVFFVEYHRLNYGVKHHIFDKYFAHSQFHVFCVNNVIVFFVEYHQLNYGVKHDIFDEYFSHSQFQIFVEYLHINKFYFDKYLNHSWFHIVCVNHIIDFFAVINDQSMYIYGGEASATYGQTNEHKKLDDLWEYSVADESWIDLTALAQEDSLATGDFKKPCARSQHAAVLDTTKYQMLIFGGACYIRGDFEAVNDLWQYDIVQKQWRQIISQFDPRDRPAPRRHLTAVLEAPENMMYVFGGRGYSSDNGETVYNDLWKCDVNTFGWTLLTAATKPFGTRRLSLLTPETKPPALYAHSSVFDDVGKAMYVFGGFNSTHQHVTDVWQYSVSSNSWRKLSQQLPLCHPFVSNVVTAGGLLLYSETFSAVIAPSGIDAESAIYLTFDTCSNEGGKVWKYYLSDGRWEQVTWSMTDHLMGHSAVYFEMNDTIY
ncbi:unnamed protein product, partial [Polarella glacialis]